jgi:transglutaminase-like putative cysteine protease
MVYRYSWVAGLGAVAFSFWELTKLLRPSVGSTHWQLIVLAGLALGMIITWTALSYRMPMWLAALLNAGALFLAAARFAAPESTVLVFPTGASIGALGTELQRAWELIQNGVEPVIPLPGLVIIVTAVFWAMGAALVWGLMKSHPFTALVPPLVVALQFATVDRNESGLLRIGIFLALVAAAIISVNADERDVGAGRMAKPGEWPDRSSGLPSPSASAVVGLTVLTAVFAVGLLNPVVPRDGIVTWRNSTGLTGDFFGSIAYNPFVQIQRGLLTQTDTPVFVATVDGDLAPTDVYFRLLTLETYSGGQWYADSPQVSRTTETPWQVESEAYAGPTDIVDATVRILALRMDWLPAPYAAFAASADDGDVDSRLRVRRTDASLRYDGGLSYEGMTYQVSSAVPRFDSDALASTPAGTLSPLFTTAAAAEQRVPQPRADLEQRELENADRYLELPEDLDPQVRAEARAVAQNLITPFEKGLALEKWFRENGGFVYDVNVTPGHGSDTLTTWLFDAENPDRRRGYCEQFATAMALMARTIDVPSRVVLGFTPGERISADQVVVRDKNAHAWVELWIPSQGWVSFDPTPRSDGANPTTAYGTLAEAIGYDITEYLADVPAPDPRFAEGGPNLPPQLAEDLERDNPFFPGGDLLTTERGLPGWLIFAISLGVLLVLLVAVIPGVKWIRSRRRMHRLERGDITAAWEEIVVRLTDLGEPPDPAKTPVEVANAVDLAMRPLAGVYGRSIYGAAGTSEADVDIAMTALDRTTERLNTRYPASRRLLAWYRIGSLLPAEGLRRRRNGRS